MFRSGCVRSACRLLFPAGVMLLLVRGAYGQAPTATGPVVLRRLPAVEQSSAAWPVDRRQPARRDGPPRHLVQAASMTDQPDAWLALGDDRPHAQLMPPGYQPWWQPQVIGPLRSTEHVEKLDVTQLVLDALVHSEHIKALQQQPAIRELAILEAEAEFDVTTFMDSKFLKTSEPVGDDLTTGGPPRFRESDWNYAAGVRRKYSRGGKFEAAQRIGYLNNNSRFLNPTQQGNARLTLSFEQPLMRGAGKYYNTSLIMLAQIDTQVARDQTTRELQSYLLDVHRAYWELYLQRAVLLQMKRSSERAQKILTSLEQRQDFDSLRSQIVIAQAAVATRRSELVRAAAAVGNAQARIAALVNSPLFVSGEDLELLPAATPKTDYVPIKLEDAMVTALNHRPEVDEALNLLEAARVRLEVSKNELLPVLSLVLETYVAGLEGRSDIGQALGNQFSTGEPSYTAGLLFEMPFGNRAARARHQRRHRELTQLTHRFNALIANLRAEIEVAVREVNTTYGEVQSKYAAMTAADSEVDFMTQRFELLPGDDRAASFLLEDLLTAQDRLSAQEFAFVDAQISYAVALAEMKRATGVLLQYELLADGN